jgi:hypothetical protein
MISFKSSNESKFDFFCSLDQSIKIIEWINDNLHLDSISKIFLTEHRNYNTDEKYFGLSVIIVDKTEAAKLKMMRESFA